jgi:DNA-binding transcriptional MocR family regulator
LLGIGCYFVVIFKVEYFITYSFIFHVYELQRNILIISGWPAPTLLPASLLSVASKAILSTPTSYVPALQYAPDEGPLALRNALSTFLTNVYGRSVPIERICTSGGASQNLGVTLAAFTDPEYTRTVFVVEPTYYLACRIIEDAGLKICGVPDGDEGVDMVALRKALEAAEATRKKELGGEADVPVRYSLHSVLQLLIPN